MKLERISAAAQTELPNAKPLRRSHSVSKISAPVPERKRTAQKRATRPRCDPMATDVSLVRDTCDFCELITIAYRSGRPQHHSPGNSSKKGARDDASFGCVNQSRIVERQHGNEQ